MIAKLIIIGHVAEKGTGVEYLAGDCVSGGQLSGNLPQVARTQEATGLQLIHVSGW